MALSNITFRPFIAGMRPEPTINPSNAILMGLGNSTSQPTDGQTDKNWLSFYLKSTGASGTSRGMYLRLYIDSGAGGEALRAFTTVSNAAPADTVNGAHISLNFGSSAGNVTGEAHALRGTFHLPTNRTIGGTVSALQAEFYTDGSNSGSYTSNASFLRMIVDGDSDKSKFSSNTAFYLFSLQGITDAGDGVNGVFRTSAPATLGGSLKILIGSTVYYLPLYTAQS